MGDQRGLASPASSAWSHICFQSLESTSRHGPLSRSAPGLTGDWRDPGWCIREPAASPKRPLRWHLVLIKLCGVALFFVHSLVDVLMIQCTATQSLSLYTGKLR